MRGPTVGLFDCSGLQFCISMLVACKVLVNAQLPLHTITNYIVVVRIRTAMIMVILVLRKGNENNGRTSP